MGYTNYWRCRQNWTNEEWAEIQHEYEYLKEMCGDLFVDESEIAAKEWESYPDDGSTIIFNGIGELSHETFVLEKELFENGVSKRSYYLPGVTHTCESQHIAEGGEDSTFDFCKTAAKPYDVVVWHLLSFCKNLNSDTIEISRDRPTAAELKEYEARKEAERLQV